MVTCTNNGHFLEDKCVLPRLASIYDYQVSSNVMHLDFSYLVNLGTLSTGAFNNFHRILTVCLLRLPTLQFLNLKSPNSRTSLPSLNGEHLKIIGKSCVGLRYLDISFNTGLKQEDLLQLIPEDINDQNGGQRKGCPDLETLHIFDCGFSDKCVKTVALKLRNLKSLGEVYCIK